MIPLEYLLIVAFVMDLAFGDPRWAPHPVRWIGRLSSSLEDPFRRIITDPKVSGLIVALIVIITTGIITLFVIWVAYRVHPLVGDLISVVVMYWGVATRDLYDHCKSPLDALNQGDVDQARRRVAMICGRDTDSLDSEGISRATVESAAENLVDGVSAPLFYAALGGPVALMIYKAISTLDSTFGYKNERYMEFGWASARIDDVAAFIPSRLSGMVVPFAAGLIGLSMIGSYRIFFRDRLKHPSPNAGHGEAAFAGALGVALGGESVYGGKVSIKPLIGDPINKMGPEMIQRAYRLLMVSSVMFLFLMVMARYFFRIYLGF